MYTLRSLIVLVALLGVFAPAVEAKERPMLAVLDFASGGAELTQEELSLLSDVSRATARRVLGTAYTIITQESIEQLLKAHGKTLEQCQGECETETGKLLGAELVVSGRVVKAFGKLKVNLKLHRTDPPELLDARVLTVDTLPELEEAVTEATVGVLSALTDAPAASGEAPSTDSRSTDSSSTRRAQGPSLKKSIKRAAKDVAKSVVGRAVEKTASKVKRKAARKAARKAERKANRKAAKESDVSDQRADQDDRDWRGDTEWFGLYGAAGQSTQFDGLSSTTGGGIVIELLKFRFPFGEHGYGFLGLGGARITTSATESFGNTVTSTTLSGALMVGYGYALGSRHGLELSVGYGSGSYERTTEHDLNILLQDVTGPQSTLSYHYRLDSMSIRGGFLTQALLLNDEVGNSVQVSAGFLGVAY